MSFRFISIRSLKVVEGLSQDAIDEMERDHGLIVYRVPSGSGPLVEENNLFDAVASICHVRTPLSKRRGRAS
jgi:hypothetical protein